MNRVQRHAMVVLAIAACWAPACMATGVFGISE
jgi:hypothetical protein